MPFSKLFLAFCAIFFLSISVKAQYQVDELLKLKPEKINKYSRSLNANTVEFPMDFNSPRILNPKEAEALKGKSIKRVELYYTDFQIAESFNQPVLNRERFAELKRLCPDIFKQSLIEWRIIGQDGSRNVADAKNYFHGFVITYVPVPDKDLISAETKTISSIVKSDSLGHDTELVSLEFRYRKIKRRTGFYLPASKHKRDAGIKFTKKGIWNRKQEYYVKTDTIVLRKKRKEFIRSKDALTFMKRIPDSTVLHVLDRNPQWSNILFVCDVTGSMSPYTTQILVWHKLNCRLKKAKYFTFFNDGDDIPDYKKRIGRTGGIYSVAAEKYEDVEATLLKTMEKGGGGDAPENNCEAILKALQEMPDAGEIVMIADNAANIKDLVLADNIKKPVRIILCGAERGCINADYLELARKTKGSVHIMNDDLDGLIKRNEGEVFSFGKKLFKISGGKIISYNPV